MSGVLSYFAWRVRVLNLLMEGTHRTDKGGPVLTSVEQKAMELSYQSGASPEEFVEALSNPFEEDASETFGL